MTCGPKLGTNTGLWRRKFNKELLEDTGMSLIKCYTRGQRIQWFGRVMRGNDDNTVITVMSRRTTGKRPRGRPRKKWMDVVEEDLKKVGVNDWRNTRR